MEALTLKCPSCGCDRVDRAGLRYLADDSTVQRYECRKCHYRFSDKINKIAQDINKRQIGALEAKNLDSASEIKTIAGDGKTNLIDYGWRQKKRDIQDNTIFVRTCILKQLLKKGCDLFNTDSVETYLATEPMTIAKKRNCVAAYRSFTKVYKINWEPIRVKYQPKQPFIPTHEELSALIHA